MAENKESEQKQESVEGQQEQVAENVKPEELQEYKDLQAKYEAERAAREEAESTLELVQPYVDFDALSGGKVPENGSNDDEDSEAYVSKQEVQKQLAQIDQKYNTKLLAMQFRADHPDLKPYEQTLVIPAVTRLRNAHPTWGPDRVIEEAAKETEAFLKAEREKALSSVDKKKQEEAAASGFSSTQSTAPSKEEKVETPEELLAQERKRRLQLQGEPIY